VRYTLVVPNRDDPANPPTGYVQVDADALPRQGETVLLDDTPWTVKWVEHEASNGAVRVRLIEPSHWAAP
jgi:hypothetical protein